MRSLCRRLVPLALAGLLAGLGLAGCSGRAPAPAAREGSAPETAAGGLAAGHDAGVAARPGVGFRSHERLVAHWRKHGREFGASSPAEYLRMAQALRDRPAGGDVLEAVRGDGVVTRFDRASGAFLASDADGTIRTYFKPAAGEAYFRRQLGRAHEGS